MLDLGNPRMFEAVVDSLEASVYPVDRDRKVVYWNHGAERISGYLRQQVTGRYCGDNTLAHCDEKETQLCGDACPLIDCMRDGQPRAAAVYLRHRAGHRVPVHVRAIPLRDRAGAIVGAAEIFEEHHFVPESDRRQDELGKHGCLDEGTALPNHGLMVSYLREQLNLYTEHGIPFGVFVIQPERLEIFQAAHGLEAARAILRVVAHTLKNALRPTDFLGRWRDDQFLAILNGCQEDSLSVVAQRLKATVSGSGIQWWGDRLCLAVSIGWTGVAPGDTVDTMVDRAESALKKVAKSAGGAESGGA
jgi:diguanylate cyclase (GGDEF)-like protein/PAS domain S-box-containing protein